jgi:hypothetical protein
MHPPLQMAFDAHWFCMEHVPEKQVVPLQAYAPHWVVVKAGQTPAPLQNVSLVAVPLLQVGVWQETVLPL